jgi:hypothetical protein
MTPETVHYVRAEAVTKLRAETLAKAHAAAPHRFAHGMPTPFALPLAVWINKPAAAQEATVLLQEIARTSVEVGNIIPSQMASN